MSNLSNDGRGLSVCYKDYFCYFGHVFTTALCETEIQFRRKFLFAQKKGITKTTKTTIRIENIYLASLESQK